LEAVQKHEEVAQKNRAKAIELLENAREKERSAERLNEQAQKYLHDLRSGADENEKERKQ
jgi:hypothetical protein